MPEGPEIKRAADRVAKAIAGEVARKVVFGLKRLKHREGDLSGSTVVSVTSRSKAMLMAFDCGLTVYSHNQLYGRWYTVAADKPPATGRSLRFGVYTDAHWALLYSASEIHVLEADEVEHHPYIAKLGPDLLNQRVTLAQLEARYRDAAFAGRSLGALLLDQGFIAGVGNYLRCEILFAAGVHPDARPRDLGDESVEKLAVATRDIIQRAYKSGGKTVSAARYKAAKLAGEPAHGRRFAVFDREALGCLRCGTAIEAFRQSGRRCYACANCQVRG